MLSAPRVTDLDVTLPGIPPPPKLIPGSGLAVRSAALTESEKLIVVSALRTNVLSVQTRSVLPAWPTSHPLGWLR